MGVSASEDSKLDNNRLISLPRVQLYHFGQVNRFYDQVTCREVIQAVYEFVLEPDGQDYFINQLKSNNNRCPHLVNIVRIVSEAGGLCNRGSTYHVYFQYLPVTLSNILKQQKQPLPEEEVRLLVMSLFDAVMRINERETQHGDIYPEFIYLDDRGTRKYKIFDSAYFNPLKHGSAILTQVPYQLLRLLPSFGRRELLFALNLSQPFRTKKLPLLQPLHIGYFFDRDGCPLRYDTDKPYDCLQINEQTD